MAVVRWIQFKTCRECEAYLRRSGRLQRIAFLRHRANLPRCQGCSRIREIYKAGGESGG